MLHHRMSTHPRLSIIWHHVTSVSNQSNPSYELYMVLSKIKIWCFTLLNADTDLAGPKHDKLKLK